MIIKKNYNFFHLREEKFNQFNYQQCFIKFKQSSKNKTFTTFKAIED